MSSAEDTYIGARLKEIRKRKNLSQKDVAGFLDISYQQVQQYESGATRMPASVLYRVSGYLQVEPAYFFEGIEAAITPSIKSNTVNTVRQKPLTIMLVEDNLADEEIVREAIAPLDATLDVMRNADDFLTHMSQLPAIGDKKRTELILLDLTIGRTDGIELLTSVKRNRNACDVPVILLTNSIHADDVMRAYKAGASGYIKKSPHINDMTEQLNHIIGYWSHTTLPSMQFFDL